MRSRAPLSSLESSWLRELVTLSVFLLCRVPLASAERQVDSVRQTVPGRKNAGGTKHNSDQTATTGQGLQTSLSSAGLGTSDVVDPTYSMSLVAIADSLTLTQIARMATMNFKVIVHVSTELPYSRVLSDSSAASW